MHSLHRALPNMLIVEHLRILPIVVLPIFDRVMLPMPHELHILLESVRVRQVQGWPLL